MDALRLSVVLAAIDKASAPIKRVMSGSQGMSKALRAQRKQLQKLNAQQRDVSAFRTQSVALRQSGAALEAQRAKVRELAVQIAATRSPSKQLTREFREAKRVAAMMGTAHDRQSPQLQGLRNRLSQAGISTSQLSSHERRLRGEIAQTTQRIADQQRRLTALATAQQRARKLHSAGMTMGAHGAGAAYAGARIVGAGLAPVSAFAEQEDAAMQLRGAMMDATGKVAASYAQMDALAQRLGNRLPGTTTDFYEMLTMLRRQGMSAETVLGGLGEATAYLGVQLKMGYGEAAEFIAQLQDATRSNAKDMMALTDVIQRAFYLGVDSDNMLQGFSKLSPALDVLRISGLEATKALAPLLVMADQAGMKGEAAGNAYRKVFQGMMGP